MKVISNLCGALIKQIVPQELLEQLPETTCILDAGQSLPQDCLPQHSVAFFLKSDPIKMVELAATGIGHLIMTEHPQFSGQLIQALELIAGSPFLDDPISFLLKPSPHLVGTPSLDYQCHSVVSNNAEKSAAIDIMMHHLNNEKLTRTVRESAVGAADEMLMNAIYDAPRYSNRAKPNEAEPVEFSWGYNSWNLALVVRDSYGSLDLQRTLARLHAVYSLGVAQTINNGPGGAGIGMHMILENASSLYLVVVPGQHTTVACLFHAGRSRRNQHSEKKSLHVVQRKYL